MTTPFDQIIVGDFESSWGRAPHIQLGFSTQTNEEYVRDPRFKAWGISWKYLGSAADPVWVTHKDLPEFFQSIDWSRTGFLAQNTMFDAFILSHHYGVHPAFLMDTLSMGRALRGVEVGNSLAKLAAMLGLPEKGKGLASSENILDELPAHVEAELSQYCCHDTWLCEQIFYGLGGWDYPLKELRLIDMTLKMYTRPVLELDSAMLVDALHEEKEKREELLQRLGVDEAVLASNPQFAATLEALGIPAPRKISKTTGKSTLALAKNDAMFQALLNGENEDVALLCEARLKVKSTTERTRAQRFLDISRRGALPVPLSYYGASTGRWGASRGSAINMQNLKRGSFLRKSIMAPAGHQLVVGDLSQIEPRVLAWLADYEDMLDIFRAGGDPYAAFGAQMFDIPGLTKESHPDLRQSAKSALLGCGYGLGWASFASQLTTGFLGAPPVRYSGSFARQLGVTKKGAIKFLEWLDTEAKLRDIPHTCSIEELVLHCLAAKAIIDKYRRAAAPVVALWNLFGSLIQYSLYEGNEYTHKCVTFKKGEIVLPSGMSLLYPDLTLGKDEQGRPQWTYGADKTKLYAGKITNNVTQGVARCVMTDGMLRTAKKYFVAGTVHDEQIVVVPDDEVADAKTWVLAQMTMEPKYMPGIPLAADGGAHRRYGLAKN